MKEYFHGLNIIDEEERQDCLMAILKLASRAIIAGFIIGLAFYTAKLYAQKTDIPVHVIDEGAVKMHLLSTPCSDPVSALIAAQLTPPQYADRWRGLTSSWKHRDGSWKDYAGCWLELTKEEAGADDAVLFFTFADGGYGNVKKSAAIKRQGSGA